MLFVCGLFIGWLLLFICSSLLLFICSCGLLSEEPRFNIFKVAAEDPRCAVVEVVADEPRSTVIKADDADVLEEDEVDEVDIDEELGE